MASYDEQDVRALMMKGLNYLATVKSNQKRIEATMLEAQEALNRANSNISTFLLSQSSSGHRAAESVQGMDSTSAPLRMPPLQMSGIAMDATPLVLPFHDRIMHLSPDPFGHDMQQILLNMTQSQFVEITQESAQVILPVLQYLLETTESHDAIRIIIDNLERRFFDDSAREMQVQARADDFGQFSMKGSF